MAILILHLDWQTAAALAQVVATVLAAVGIITSLYIGIRTLQEVQSDRLHRVRPKLLFDQGARGVECALEERIGILGIDPGYAAELLKGRPPHARSCVAKGLWGDLTNHGSGAALNASITIFARKVRKAGEEFSLDAKKLLEFPYSPELNYIPAHPSHIDPGKAGGFLRLPTPVTIDYTGQLNSMECVVLIQSEDIYGNRHETWQEMRVRVERQENSARVLLTFGAEILASASSATIEELKMLRP